MTAKRAVKGRNMSSKQGGGADHQADDLELRCLEFLNGLSKAELRNIIYKLRTGNDAAEELLFGWKTMNDETIAFFLSICRLSFATLLVEFEHLLPTEAQNE